MTTRPYSEGNSQFVVLGDVHEVLIRYRRIRLFAKFSSIIHPAIFESYNYFQCYLVVEMLQCLYENHIKAATVSLYNECPIVRV